ncbi:MAG TPA: branched-chain amino acid aminotransferase [Hungateiclostridium thermocellum]|jgi:branched-chain amino acid aminotransferase|uniref:Branched-chain-amino-acid aminotransferase n=2 Tax=Acetivibrio thermocellus TaxID=1515 RepID=A3DDR1_ACET2|nr:branched-chain amino acid aminotransferase [Acetivibrio thermocellus]CDG35548.1 Branched-chain-amino-acid aminotransferase 2 [Acetivibrio thermocellus BC1]ABN52090.1 branched-chain amino acid aminotransferase [Acetivibrio thermocellus ATCC 27405]ADU74427.1 branched-chain amino acid aminotransferase [Acetivibrio thermocellus DSM 1313]ALX08370.1 branched-chain amino acid aminotransferase [Acetivibrio thermocellus AD2]ANV76119.1 branched-chain amino acid aminotransferase [Acetivibrio thermocel
MSYQISIQKTQNPKNKPDQDNLGFGQIFTDHMFIMDYTEGKGWHDPRIVPYGPLSLEPSTMVFHYGQAVFEGLKAYKTEDGRILLFRPRKNMERINISNERVCIPKIDVDFAVEACKTLVSVDRDWIPEAEGTSLYIRPFIISTDPFLGVRPSWTYKFIIILSPVGAYYKEGINPVKIYVESEYVRAVKGGTGYAKTPGNYAASLIAQVKAKELGYTQVLWLDGVEKKYIEEVGTMNVFFKINGEVITPSLDGSILAGITRESTIELLRASGIKVTERKITIEEIYNAHEAGTLEEAFGTGTAAVISPIGELSWNGKVIKINDGKIGETASFVYNTITGIQSGKIEDKFGWTVEVK